MIGPDHLSADREERLHEVLLGYLEADALGDAPDPRQLLEQHPEFADELADFFACRQRVEKIVAPLRTATASSSGMGEIGAFRSGFGSFAPTTQLLPRLPPTLPGLTHCDHRPCVLGDFRLFREVGRGGMGIVYEAEQLSLGRRVALKMLPFASGLDSKNLRRFKNEAQTAALLHHPNIVPVHAVGCEGGVHYFVMPFIQGRSMADLIEELRRQNGVSPSVLSRTQSALRNRTVAGFGLRAAQALEYAHQQGVVHRDIKPANLLLDDRGELWITDFGLAMFQTGTGVTATGELIGTLRYMSPEQALAKRNLVDHRTDIYSLGATLYELLTLQPVFSGQDGQELLCQIANREPRPPRSIDRTISIDLETVLLKAMAKNPMDRYATAQELAEDLQRFLEDKPIRARRPTLLDKAAKWARRHKALVALGVVVLFILLVGLVISNVLIAREQAEAKAAYAREQQQRVRAEANFRQARQAVDFFVALSDEGTRDRTQLFEMRMRLLEAALTYYQDFIEQHGDDPSIQAELANSQARAARILQELPAMQHYRRFELLGNRAVQDDLGLSETQRDRVAACGEEILRRWRKDADELRQRGDSRRQRAAERGRWCEQTITDILRPGQSRRLQQIAYQQMGIRAFNHADVAEALGLSQRQRKDLVYRFELQRIHHEQELWRATPLTTTLEQVYQKILEQRRRSMEQILEVLTAQQRAYWQELTGAPFRGDVRLLLGGRHRFPY